MNTITDADIRNHVVLPALSACEGSETDYDVDAIMADLLDTYPVSEWEYAELQYTHPSGTPDFWDIIARHDRTQA